MTVLFTGKDYPTFGPSILCKLNPSNPGCGRKSGGGGGNKGGRSRQNKNAQRAGRTGNNKAASNADFQAQIANGEIPGTPGKVETCFVLVLSMNK